MKSYSSEKYSLEECKKDFISILKGTKREGVEELLNFLERTDFFTAPASTRFHEAREGGLLRHCLNVYVRLTYLYTQELEISGTDLPPEKVKADIESLTIVSLLHDLCKCNYYQTDFRNVKNADGAWEKVPYYRVRDNILGYGHGEESVYILSAYIKLSREEAFAIRFHMGDLKGDPNTGRAYSKYPLALMLHLADMMATYMDEVEDE